VPDRHHVATLSNVDAALADVVEDIHAWLVREVALVVRIKIRKLTHIYYSYSLFHSMERRLWWCGSECLFKLRTGSRLGGFAVLPDSMFEIYCWLTPASAARSARVRPFFSLVEPSHSP